MQSNPTHNRFAIEKGRRCDVTEYVVIDFCVNYICPFLHDDTCDVRWRVDATRLRMKNTKRRQTSHNKTQRRVAPRRAAEQRRSAPALSPSLSRLTLTEALSFTDLRRRLTCIWQCRPPLRIFRKDVRNTRTKANAYKYTYTNERKYGCVCVCVRANALCNKVAKREKNQKKKKQTS